MLVGQDLPKDGANETKELVANRVGALIPANFWKNHWADILWATKSTPDGLRAVRPPCCLTQGVTLSHGQALACN